MEFKKIKEKYNNEVVSYKKFDMIKAMPQVAIRFNGNKNKMDYWTAFEFYESSNGIETLDKFDFYTK